ncbi:MAG: hypothetical protein ACLSB9_23015 [Hydrogeniiclostridium mannosilyticum]
MMEENYKNMLYVIDDYFEKEWLIIQWKNGLKVRCKSITGMYETDTEPGDEDYIGEYAAAVGDVEVIEPGTDESVLIYNDCIEISLQCIPQKIMLEDGTVLWESQE